MNDEFGNETDMPEYWPARTINVGSWSISYCDLMQYIFAAGLLSVIGFVVFGIAREPARPHQ